MKIIKYLIQWRPEGLQRPGVNAWIGAAPRLVNPASAPGGKNRQAKKQKKTKKSLQKKTKKTPREIGALESSGPIAFAPFKFAPTSWAGAPSKACARGPWPPCPPPRYATDLAYASVRHLGTPLAIIVFSHSILFSVCFSHQRITCAIVILVNYRVIITLQYATTSLYNVFRSKFKSRLVHVIRVLTTRLCGDRTTAPVTTAPQTKYPGGQLPGGQLPWGQLPRGQLPRRQLPRG